jgi:hypothetical protein
MNRPIDKETSILKFDGPFGLVRNSRPFLFDQAEAKEPGIYLWTTPYCQGGYLVTYVGETGASFEQRLKDHLIQTVGGNYRICDPDSLTRGEAKVIWNGLWRKGTRDKFHEYIERFEEFAPLIRKLLQIEFVFIAPFRSQRRIRQRVEGAIAAHIRSRQAPASSVLPSDVRYYQRKADEIPVRVTVQCHCDVLGLPQELQA